MLRKFDSGGPLRTLVETACLRDGTPFHPGIVNDIGHIAAPLHLSVENPSSSVYAVYFFLFGVCEFEMS